MRPLTLATALLLAGTGAVSAQDSMAGHAMRPDQLAWMPAPPVLPKGAQATVLAGDPAKAGPFTIRLKAPAGYRIPAHSHPSTERVTVISGDFRVGMGDRIDEAKAQQLGSGGFIELPANMNHYALMGSETVVQIDSTGPFAITYVDPAEDPRKSQ